MSLAKEEAIARSSMKVGTEHLLLALAKEDEGIAAEALRSLDITYDDIATQLDDLLASRPGETTDEPDQAKLAFTPSVIAVMERSFRLARENNQTYVSTEHLLVGMVDETACMGLDIFGAPGRYGGLGSCCCREAHVKRPGEQAVPWQGPVLGVPARACRFSRARRARARATRRACSSSLPPTSPSALAKASLTRLSAARRKSRA